MNKQKEHLTINYKGATVLVTAHCNGTDTFFTVHLPGNDLQLGVDYVDNNPVWIESDGNVTERSEEIGRLIEEYDGR